MSDLETIRESLSELNNSSKQFLISALIEMDQELTRVENTRDQYHEAHNVTRNRADLHARRCEIALAILRDDEAGLTYNQLNRLADVIWPKQIDVTQKPTVISDSTSVVPNPVADLVHMAVVYFRELLKVMPGTKYERGIECDDCGHIQTESFEPPFELAGLKHQIEAFQLNAKELLNKLYGRFYE